MVVVIFDEDFHVTEGLYIDCATVERLFPHRDYVNGRVITVTKQLREDEAVRAINLSDAALDLPA